MVKQPKLLCQACGTENDTDEISCRRCKLPLTAAAPDITEANIICPRCQKTNNAGSFFCYACGKYFADIEGAKPGTVSKKKRRSAKARSAPKAKIIMPGGSELTLTSAPVFIERSDFDSKLPRDILMQISRQHALITYSRGKYYLQDYGRDGKGSTNHTKLNGIDIYGKGKKSLKDSDKIELAGQQKLTLVFRLPQEPE
ncbi:MAG: FHA domain-containing protein [Chloroflexi bacterium]|nr:FHA domain-containing protein [Chloroflexota bacterium]MBM3175677.1 FHA domain-containing protein [Chloroflexota bacterium]MBM4450447.1 FHA domain-containing protein [Chloroflexota bacterium]